MNTLLSNLKIIPYAFSKATVGKWWHAENNISPFARIYLICDGEQHVSFRDWRQHQKPGRAYLLPPFTPTTYACHDSCEEYYFIFSCLLPDGSDFFAHYRCNYEFAPPDIHYQLCQALFEALPNYGLINTNANDENFNQLILHPSRALKHHSQSLKIQGCILEMLAHFMIRTETSRRLIRFATVLQYIEKNTHKAIAVNELADIENLSATYFSDQFLKHMGVRPSEYIAQKKEDKAKELLQISASTIDEVATLVGIPDVSYFCRFFKKRSGYSPKKYRSLYCSNG